MRALKLFVSSALGGACIGLGALPTCLWRTGWQGRSSSRWGSSPSAPSGSTCSRERSAMSFRRGDRPAAPAPHLAGEPGGHRGGGCGRAADQAGAPGEKATGLCRVKLEDSLPSVFLLAVLCNVFIYIAVEGFRSNPHEIGKYLSLFFGVMGFVLCGFEHCVANMFYISTAGLWSGRAAGYLLVMTLGNSAGGVLIPLRRPF